MEKGFHRTFCIYKSKITSKNPFGLSSVWKSPQEKEKDQAACQIIKTNFWSAVPLQWLAWKGAMLLQQQEGGRRTL